MDDSQAVTAFGVNLHLFLLCNGRKLMLLSNTGSGLLENHKATEPACNVGPSSARQRNAIFMGFRWWAGQGQLLMVLGFRLSPLALIN